MATTSAFRPLREAIQIGVLAVLAILVAMNGASRITPYLLGAGFFVALNGYLRTRAWEV
jgi:hypothetical protein